MNLQKFIEEIGDDAAADLFDIKPRTAAAYRRGERQPPPKKAEEFCEKANGRLDMGSIYKGWRRYSASRNHEPA